MGADIAKDEVETSKLQGRGRAICYGNGKKVESWDVTNTKRGVLQTESNKPEAGRYSVNHNGYVGRIVGK